MHGYPVGGSLRALIGARGTEFRDERKGILAGIAGIAGDVQDVREEHSVPGG